MAIQRTYVMIKPDGVKRGLIGEIIRRIENKGLRIIALKMLRLSREKAEELYSVHRGKPFFESLIEFVTSGPVVAMIVEGEEAVNVMRTLIGPTDGRKAPPGTIRGDFALSVQENIIHAADSVESAEREMWIVFSKDEVVSY
ncbi:MAG: nucleoside-diphosphate kinase [Desulfurococcales archaeon ex4484_217_2]|nr:MAG: nucleoside-diphosphate kinase [Desulfurococcales archaeon ex4484_217_2]